MSSKLQLTAKGNRTGAAIGFFLFAFAAPNAWAKLTISSQATQNMSCSGGVCAPTAMNAVLNTGDLETMLASGNLSVTTTGAGVQANDIIVKAAFSWSSGGALMLDAYRSLEVDKPVSVQGLAGLTILTDRGGSRGTLSFGRRGNVTFANLSSSLSINGTSYTLEGSISSLASAIVANPSGGYAFANSYDASQDGTYSASPIATAFSGSFEGLGNTISNLTIDDPVLFDHVGLFGALGSGGILANLHLQSADVTGAGGDTIGGLVGLDEGSIIGDSGSGTVSINDPGDDSGAVAGGLIGLAFGGAVTLSSYSHSRVNGEGVSDSVGGLIGALSASSISNSYATGSTNGFFNLGGLVGFVSSSGSTVGAINGCYATGGVTGHLDKYTPSAGGLVGYGAGASILNSYATDDVREHGPSSAIGGLVGFAANTSIGSSYSIGTPTGSKRSYVGGFLGENGGNGTTMTDAYWDTTTSGTDTGVGEGSNAGVTGLTTAQLQSGLPQGFDPKIWGQNPNINGGLPYLLSNRPSN